MIESRSNPTKSGHKKVKGRAVFSFSNPGVFVVIAKL